MCLLRDKTPKFFSCCWATRAILRKLPVRPVKCELRQHRRNATQAGCRFDPRFYSSLHDHGSVVT